jgi:PST family polysaccharide transporter
MPPSLRPVVVRGMAWATVARAGEEGCRLLGRLILARLLWPGAFGTFTLAAAIVAGAQLATQLQLSASVVQRPALSAGMRSTALWSSVALGLLGTALLIPLAAPLGALVGDPAVAPVVRLLGAVVALSACSVIPRAWLWRELRFRQLAAVDVAAEFAGTAVGVAAALRGAGVYSLAAHAIVVELFEGAAIWWLVRWRPAWHWRFAELLDLVSFGGPLAGRRGLDYLVAYGDRFLVGAAFGPAALGLYALGLRLVKGVAQGIGGIFERVGFPVFARTQDDLGRSRRGFLDALRVQAAVTFPAVVGVALVAPDLVPLLPGPAWVGAVPLVQFLAVRSAATSLLALPRAALAGRGRQWLVVSVSAGTALALAAGWLAGAAWGTRGVAAGGALGGIAAAGLALALLRREVPVSVAEVARALAPALCGTAAMAAAVAVASPLLAAGPAPGRSARLAVVVLVGAAAYVLPLAPWLLRERRRYFARAPEPSAALIEAEEAAIGPDRLPRG